MARTKTIPNLNEILAAAERFKTNCLLADRSVFSENALWTASNINLLDQYFIQNPLAGKETFIAKLGKQLKPAAPEVKQLAAEMVWLLLLFPSNITGNKKRETVAEIWSWSGTTLDEQHPLLKVLDYGIGSSGIAYNNKRPAELTFLIELMQRWKTEGSQRHQALLSDPWAFGTWVDALPSTGKRQLRHMMLYLLFPDSFERISSTGNKQKIVAALSRLLTTFNASETDSAGITVDRQLLTIRHGLEGEHKGQEIDFYNAPARGLWLSDDEPEAPTEDEPLAASAPCPSTAWTQLSMASLWRSRPSKRYWKCCV